MINHWWQEKDDEVSTALWDLKGRFLQQDNDRLENYRRYFNLFWNVEIGQITPSQLVGKDNLYHDAQRLTLNVILSAVDTIVSRITGYKPKPMFVTHDGNFELKNRAKLLEKFVDGVFYRNNIYELARCVFLDAAVFGTGVFKIFEEDSEVRIERVYPGEIFIDTQTYLTSEPRQFLQVKHVPAERLKDVFTKPEQIEAIDKTQSPYGSTLSDGMVLTTDLVEVVEAWHLKSGKTATDGKHVIAVNGKTLLFEDYDDHKSPFVFVRWNRPNLGFWGTGAVEQVKSEQWELNKMLSKVQGALHIYAHTKTFIEAGSVDKHQFRNVTGDIIEVAPGTKNFPKTEMPPSLNSEVFHFMQQLKSDIYENLGVSQLSAAGLKPPGIESGKAIYALQEVESVRYAQLADRWGQVFVDLAERVVTTGKKIYTYNKHYKTKYVARDFVETIEWKNVDMSEEDYVLRIYPINILPSTPAGKLAMVQQLMNNEFIDRKEALDLLDFPDLARWQSNETADLDLVDMIIDDIIIREEMTLPDNTMDIDFLALGVKRMNNAYMKAKKNKAPKKVLDMLMEWMIEAHTLIQGLLPQQPQEEGM